MARSEGGQAVLSINVAKYPAAVTGQNRHRWRRHFPPAIGDAINGGLLASDPVHYVTKHLQQGVESDHFRVKKNMPKIGGFRSFNSARKSIADFKAMLWLRKGFDFTGHWTVRQ